MLTEQLVNSFLNQLSKSGRDWLSIRQTITEFEDLFMKIEVTDEQWEDEFKLYLGEKLCEVMAITRDISIELEEYEWAHELTLRLDQLGWTKPVEATWKVINVSNR